ncbi:MAG: M23 family metallopeptidase [bacterium]
MPRPRLRPRGLAAPTLWAGPARWAAHALCAALLLAGCGAFEEEGVYEVGYRRGVYHTVRRGETLWGIARHYGAGVEEIAVINGLPDPDRLPAGLKIFIPRTRRPAARASFSPAAPSEKRERPRWARPLPEARASRRSAPRKGKPSSPPRKASLRRRKGRGKGRVVQFAWPVRGRIVRRFGRRNGTRSDGIDIAARRKAPVRATAPGRVIYSDWGPGGYGRTIIIRHVGGAYHSVYAHNEVNLVKKGDIVKRGAQIARVGKTGRTRIPKLHFEIRHRTIPRDPLFFLP